MGEVDFEKLKRAVRRLGELEGKKPPRKVPWKLMATVTIACVVIAALAVWRPWERGPVKEPKVRYTYELSFYLSSFQPKLVGNRIEGLIIIGPELRFLPNAPLFEGSVDMLSLEGAGWTWGLAKYPGPIDQIVDGVTRELIPPRTTSPVVELRIHEGRPTLSVDTLYIGEIVWARYSFRVSKEMDNAIISSHQALPNFPLWIGENAYFFFLPHENIRVRMFAAVASETVGQFSFVWKQTGDADVYPPSWVSLRPPP